MSDENKCCGNHDHDHEEGCCGNHDHNREHEGMEVPTMVLTMDDDSELECYVLGIFEAEAKEYIALLPIGEEDVYLYRYTEEGDDEVVLDIIEDDAEYDRVSEVFMKLSEEEE